MRAFYILFVRTLAQALAHSRCFINGIRACCGPLWGNALVNYYEREPASVSSSLGPLSGQEQRVSANPCTQNRIHIN